MKPAFLLTLLLTPAFSQNPYNEKPSYVDLPARKLLGTALRIAP